MDKDLTNLAPQYNSARWPVLLVNSGLRVEFANRAAAELFGAHLLEAGASIESIWAGEKTGSFAATIEKTRRLPQGTGAVKLKVATGEPRLLQILVCETNSSPQAHWLIQVLDPANSPAAAASAPILTEAVAHRQKLECALQLARTVALDFNNSLTSILGHISLILARIEPDHPWRKALLEVEKSAERAAETAHDLAAFSRSEKRDESNPQGNINVILRRVAEAFKASTPKKIQWVFDFEEPIFACRFDEAKIQQAFTRLVDNAVDAIDDFGAIRLRSRNIAPAKTGGLAQVLIQIEDSGHGIPKELMSRVFEPFFTTKKEHRGLGLALVYGIVTNHGGTVSLISEPDQGTTVSVQLAAEAKPVRDLDFDESQLRGTETLLVVDDDELVLNMAQAILSAFGYTVIAVRSGKAALEEFEAVGGKVDMVLTDLVMPGMGGRELADELSRRRPGLPIVTMSGFIRGGTNTDEAFLQKPFTAQDLLRRVRTGLA